MQLHSSLVSLLAILSVLEPTLSVAIVRPQAYFGLESSLTPQRSRLDARMTGLRFFRRKTTASLLHDWNDFSRVKDQEPDASHIPKRAGSLITLRPILGGGDQGAKHIFVGKHEHRRSFGRRISPTITKARRSSAQISDVRIFGTLGVAGTIDIMSPTAESPIGERIASLSVSTESSEQNQFVLNASGVNASTVYLVVKSEVPMKDGALTVALQVPVFDQAKASYVAYCATFDTTQASPLTAVECISSDQDVTDHSSQLFSYNSSSGVIKPLWLTSAPPPDMESPSSAKEENAATTEEQELPEESEPTGSTSGSSNSTLSGPQSVSLVFTPDLDSSTPVVNSQSSIEVVDGSNSRDSASSIPSSTPTSSPSEFGMAMSTRTPSHTATMAMGTVEAASVTMCPHSAMMMHMPSPSSIVGDSMQPPRDVEASPMTDEPTSQMMGEPTFTSTISSMDAALPTETPTKHRRDTGMEGDGLEVGGDEDQTTDSDETIDMGISNNEAKREVDTAYVWKFSSARAVGDDGDFVQ